MIEFILSLLMLWCLWWMLQGCPQPRPLRIKPFKPFSTSATPGKSGRSSQAQRFFSTVQPTRKSPSKPKFINSKPNSEAKQLPPAAPKAPRKPTQPPSFVEEPQIKPAFPSQPKSEINFDAIQREATRQRKELNRVASKTQYELYRLANGNVQTIDRLLIHARSRYPDRPEQWIWEKVIYDLERDRR